MRRTKGRDNPFERAVRSLLFAHGVRYRVHYPVPGTKRRSCDIAIPGRKIAIFLDGCFWHGCPDHGTGSKTDPEFWTGKISRNAERDRETTRSLEAAGWTVLRFWEHQARGEIVATILLALGRPVPSDLL